MREHLLRLCGRRCVAAPGADPFTTKRNALVRGGGRAGRPYKALPNQCSNCTVTVRVSGLMVKRNRFVTVPMGGGAAPPVPPPLVPWGTSSDCVL